VEGYQEQARRAARTWSLRAIGMVVLVVLGAGADPAGAGAPGFHREDLTLAGRGLFDLGAADVDDDLDLDLFTTNHLDRQSLLVNDGAGQFTERLYELGLAQTRAFPGWEERDTGSVAPGLHISHARSALHLEMVGTGNVRGTVRFLLETRAAARGDAHAVVRRRSVGGRDAYLASFNLGPDSKVRFDPARMAHPFQVRIRQPYRLEQVYVGEPPSRPVDRRFTLQLRDRHGMAWADVGGDASADVFVVRGGLQGRIRDLVGAIEDELLIGRDGGFDPARPSRAPQKGACRGRAAGAVDFSRDGVLDLFATCRNGGTRLYRRTASGFAHKPGVLDSEAVRWLDLDGDAGLEVLGAYPRGFAVFDVREDGSRRVQVLPGRHRSPKKVGFAQADFDNDGDQDVYAASPVGSTLLRNVHGELRPRPPGRAALPDEARAAGWSDYDNDGLQDLLVVPGGLFRQSAPGTFAAVGDLPAVEDEPLDARLVWADLDANGARDAVIAARSKETRQDWKAVAYMGDDPANRWLEVALAGPDGNRQAIGARVRVRSGGSTQTQWVGQNETSLYSQGHYRLYFGLGGEASADVTVRWPDGKVHRLSGVSADQLLAVQR